MELLDQGTDTVLSYVDCALGPNMENLTLLGEAKLRPTGNALDRLVAGGAGEDTAVLQGAGVTLDLTDRSGLRMRCIDTLDITGSGNNTFVVAALQVLEQQNLLNRMVVLGNEGDLVRMSGAWTEGALTTLDGRSLRTFSSGSATLLLDSRVTVGS